MREAEIPRGLQSKVIRIGRGGTWQVPTSTLVETEELPGTVVVEAQSPTSKNTEGNASMETLSCFWGFGIIWGQGAALNPPLLC